jgi:hypothetical protein
VARKKPARKKEPTPERGITWPRWTGFRGKTVWDWLQLLIVPFALAGIGFWFTEQQDARQQALEEQRAQDAALQAYLDEMGDLMLNRKLQDSQESDPVRILARARTATILTRLDAERNNSVLLIST